MNDPVLNDALWSAKNRAECEENYSSMINLTGDQAKEIGLPPLGVSKREDKIKKILEIMNEDRFHNSQYRMTDESNLSSFLKKKFRLSAYQILKDGRMWGCTETSFSFMALAKYYGIQDVRLIHGVSPVDYQQCVCSNGVRIHPTPCGENVPPGIPTHDDPTHAISSHWMVVAKDLGKNGQWTVIDVAAQGSSYETKTFPIEGEPENLLRKVLKPGIKNSSLDYFSKNGLLVDYVGRNESDPLCIFSGEQSMDVAATGALGEGSRENGKCIGLGQTVVP